MEKLFAFMIVNVFLLLGFIVREKITIIKKLYIPSSIIGGILLLIAGPQILGLVDVSADIKGYSGFLIIIILTCIVFGARMNRERVHSYGDFTVVNMAMYGFELFFGVVVGCILSNVWKTLPPNWGVMSVFCFWGGHGTAASTSGQYTAAGFEDYLSLALFCATVGLITAMVCGMAVINWGIRKGFTNYVKRAEELPAWYYGGVLPKEEQAPVGNEKTSSASVNAVALQMSFIMLCIFIGWGIKYLGTTYIHPVFDEIDELVNGIIGAVILWPLMIKTKTDAYVDKKTVNQISGFCLDYLIVAALGTLRLEAVATYILPVTIFCLICVPVYIAGFIITSVRFCKEDWFEKMVNNLGQGLGSSATGLALLRCVDPNFKSASADAGGVASAVTMPIWVTIIALGPVLALSSGGTVKLLILGAAITIVFLAIGFIFFDNKDRKLFGGQK